MKTFGINLIVDSIVATIGCTAVHLLGVTVPHNWLYICTGLYIVGTLCYVVSTELEEKKRARKK